MRTFGKQKNDFLFKSILKGGKWKVIRQVVFKPLFFKLILQGPRTYPQPMDKIFNTRVIHA